MAVTRPGLDRWRRWRRATASPSSQRHGAAEGGGFGCSSFIDMLLQLVLAINVCPRSFREVAVVVELVAAAVAAIRIKVVAIPMVRTNYTAHSTSNKQTSD